MSIANVVSFWQRVQADESLQAKVAPGGSAGVPKLQKDTTAKQLTGLVTVCREAGFQCTAEELSAAEHVLRFWQEVSQDTKLQAELEKAKYLPEAEATKEIVRLAEARGFRFSADELNAVSPAVIAAGKIGEPSDRQLEALSSSLSLAYKGGWAPDFRLGPGSIARYM